MSHFDVVVIGAGFAGMHAIYNLGKANLKVQGFERGPDVGGVWYWNKYPGCRCDVASVHYSYGFSSELEQEWTWSEKFAAQPEILRYAYHVADKFKLRESFKFNSPVTKAVWDEKEKRWMVETPGENVTANFVVLCTGSLSGENNPFALDVKKFQGEAWHSSSYPETATVAGKRIAVVGTGCTGIQVVPTVVAKGAKSVTVFQRTAEWTTPSGNRKLTEEELKEIKAKYPEIRTKNYSSPFCMDLGVPQLAGLMDSEEQAKERLSKAWQFGGFEFFSIWADQLSNETVNFRTGNFVKDFIASTVSDPHKRDLLTPPPGTWFACKRPALNVGYYEVFNNDNVHIVDIKDKTLEFQPTGISVSDKLYEFDQIIICTGFDLLTGSFKQVNVHGRNGTLEEYWNANGGRTLYGLQIVGFPNLFGNSMPGAPSVWTNMLPSIEKTNDWISDCIVWMKASNHSVIEADPKAEEIWVAHQQNLPRGYSFGKCGSTFNGANIKGKKSFILPYFGWHTYYPRIQWSASNNYEGFLIDGQDLSKKIVDADAADGVFYAIAASLAPFGLPPLHLLDVPTMRQIGKAFDVFAGLPVADVAMEDVYFKGLTDNDIRIKIFRPAGAGNNSPAVVYFHGGGWVLGDVDGYSPTCSHLANHSGYVILSVNYRKSPEHPCPAAFDDCFDAMKYIAANGPALKIDGSRLAVAGDSAGGCLAAAVCIKARDEKGPTIRGQLLVYPVVAGPSLIPSLESWTKYKANVLLTDDLMNRFYKEYITNDAQLTDPLVFPLHVADASNLPPAHFVTAGVDILLSEGRLYQQKLKEGGVVVTESYFPRQVWL